MLRQHGAIAVGIEHVHRDHQLIALPDQLPLGSVARPGRVTVGQLDFRQAPKLEVECLGEFLPKVGIDPSRNGQRQNREIR